MSPQTYELLKQLGVFLSFSQRLRNLFWQKALTWTHLKCCRWSADSLDFAHFGVGGFTGRHDETYDFFFF